MQKKTKTFQSVSQSGIITILLYAILPDFQPRFQQLQKLVNSSKAGPSCQSWRQSAAGQFSVCNQSSQNKWTNEPTPASADALSICSDYRTPCVKFNSASLRDVTQLNWRAQANRHLLSHLSFIYVSFCDVLCSSLTAFRIYFAARVFTCIRLFIVIVIIVIIIIIITMLFQLVLSQYCSLQLQNSLSV